MQLALRRPLRLGAHFADRIQAYVDQNVRDRLDFAVASIGTRAAALVSERSVEAALREASFLFYGASRPLSRLWANPRFRVHLSDANNLGHLAAAHNHLLRGLEMAVREHGGDG